MFHLILYNMTVLETNATAHRELLCIFGTTEASAKIVYTLVPPYRYQYDHGI